MKKISFFFLMAITVLGLEGMAQAAPLPGIGSRIPGTPSIALTPSEVSRLVEKGNQLDRLSQRLFEQKQTVAANLIQQQEIMINELVQSLATPGASGKKSPSFFYTFSKNFKSQLPNKIVQSLTPPKGKLNIEIGSPSSPVTPEEIERAINEAFALIPTDAQILAGTPLLPEHLALIGKIVNASTTRMVIPLGFRPHQPSCNYLILGVNAHEDADGNPVAAQGSSISEYYQHIPYKDDSESSRQHRLAALEALKRVHQGIRCLPNRSLSSVDSKFSGVVMETYLRLLREGKTQAAYGLIDMSLNLAIVLFDAAKYFQIPQTSRLFCLSKAPTENLVGRTGALPEYRRLTQPNAALQTVSGEILSPALGRNFGSDCDLSLMRFLLQDPQNEPKATLTIMGIWGENPFERNAPLTKILFRSGTQPALTTIQFIEHLVDFRNWGEGNCSMQEFASSGGICRSMETCEMMEELNNVAGQFRGMLPGITGLQVGTAPVGRHGGAPGASAPASRGSAARSIPDGAHGSPNTLFGIPRLDVSSHCGNSRGGGGGGEGVSQCSFPTGGQRNFSPDPYLNHLMQCAVETASGDFTVQTDFSNNPSCRVSVSLTGVETEEERATREAAERNRAEAAERARATVAATGAGSVTSRLTSELNSRGHTFTEAQVRAALESNLHHVEDATLDSNLDTPGPGGAVGAWDGTGITVDTEHAAAGGDQLDVTLMHELIHAAIDTLGSTDGFVEAASYLVGQSTALEWFFASTDEHHSIIDALGYHQCAPDSTQGCNDSCGYADERLTRMKDCLNQGNQGTPGRSFSDVWCRLAPDRCGDHRGDDGSAAGPGSQCVGSITLDPRCTYVYCAEEGPCPPGCGPSGSGTSGTAGGAGSGGPSGTNILSDFCASNPDRCGDGRGNPDLSGGAPGTGPIPGGPEGGPDYHPLP